MLKFKKMGSDKVPLLLVTANVGSIFENPSVMLPIWTAEFLQTVSRMDPKFIALHLQEVGGKAYEKSMQYVQDFVQRLNECPELRLYDKIRTYLDEDFSSPEKFTALGNMYFAHSSLTDLKTWDFELKTYVDVIGKEIHSGNIEKVTTKEKVKFPQQFFPECKWSRKGFLRTRWMIRGSAVEFINIHLFHDASNLLAMEPFPSVYARSRRVALRHVLRHVHADQHAAPYFLFGDFNFRTDTGGVVKKITEDLDACRVQNGANAESSKLQYKAPNEQIVLTIGKKEFSHVDHQNVFREPWLQRFDRELEPLRQHLYEFPVKFPPSYPFEETVELPTHYMKTRCPAWCDRILLSQSARVLLQHQDRPQDKNLHTSRKSVAESDSSGRVSSSDSSPARSSSPATHNHQSKLEKKQSMSEQEAGLEEGLGAGLEARLEAGLAVPASAAGRRSIADPTAVLRAINSRRSETEGGSRRRLVRNQSEGSPKAGELSAELRRLVDAPARKRRDYGLIGAHTCMGDHKPIYLRVMLQTDRGRLECCSDKLSCTLCNQVSVTKLQRLPTDPDIYKAKTIDNTYNHCEKLNADHRLIEDHRRKRLRSGSLNEKIFRIPDVEITIADTNIDGIFVNNIDTSLLSAKQCLGPYTPESVDSHTPNIEDTSNCSEELTKDSNQISNIDRSVPPLVLKNRLRMLLTNDRDDTTNVKELDRDKWNSRESCKSVSSRQGGLCCLALKCYGFCRRKARTVNCKCSLSDCCTT